MANVCHKLFSEEMSETGDGRQLVNENIGSPTPFSGRRSVPCRVSGASELIRCGRFETFKDAQIVLFEFIEGYYNTKRRHSGVGYQSQDQFERSYYEHQK